MLCPCVTIPWQTNGCLSDLAGQGKLQCIYIYIFVWFTGMVHESWYVQFILNLHISSYLLVSLAHPLLSFVPFSVASDGRRV